MPEPRRKSRKLTMLTPYEDHCWNFAFSYYLDKDRNDAEACGLAWRDLQLEFPRLRGFDGCLAEVRGKNPNAKWSPLPVVIGRV